MLEMILFIKLDHYIIIIKKIKKEFMEMHQKNKLKELQDEGIETQIFPWIENKNN